MSRSLRIPLALTLVASTALGLVAPWSAHAQPRTAVQEPQETPLSQAMERMKSAARRLEKVLETDDVATALTLVAEFQSASVAAKSEIPQRAATVAGAEREAFVGDYRLTMVKLLRVTCDLEQALLEKRSDDARAIFTGELKALQKPSHERFQLEEED